MKKRKFSLILNILAICLSVCAITIGVFAIKNATLNLSGSVGFKAHNCDVDVLAKVYNDSVSSTALGGDSVQTGVPRPVANAKMYTAQVRQGTANPINFNKLYFCDMTTGGKIAPIYIELVLTNQSDYDVDASVSVSLTPSNTNVKVIKPLEVTLKDKNQSDADGKTKTVKVTLKLNQKADLTENVSFAITLNMCKARTETTLNADWNNTTQNTGLFYSGGYTFGDDTTTTILNTTNIQSINFAFDQPNSTYKIAKGLNLADTSTTEYPIYVYAKTSDGSTESTPLYDVIVYSESKIYPVTCAGMFQSWEKLKAIKFDNFYTSKVTNTNMNSVFSSCSSLTSLDLSNFNTSNVTDMSFMFASCTGLTSLDLSNFDTSSVADMSNMFTYCSSLTSLDLSNFDTSSVTNMSFMFTYCSSLTSLDLSNFNTSKVTDMCGMFDYCSKLTSLDVSNFDTSNVKDMSYMFEKCSSLTSLNLTSFNTSNVTKMFVMFNNCSKLTTINVSKDKWVISSSANTTNMFNGCGCNAVTFI